MPMIPGPSAAVTYGVIKVVGYAFFARQMNARKVGYASPIAFGAAKTALGLAGGLTYTFLLLPAMRTDHGWDVLDLTLAAPVRFVVWLLALAVFYGLHHRVTLLLGLALLGTIWSYALDALMWLVFRTLPGMTVPFC